jgi:diguanylate cyclase (GGDEF)-like protein
MGMNAPGRTGHTLLVAAPDEKAIGRVQTFLRATGGPLSAAEVQSATTAQLARQIAQEGSGFAACLLYVPQEEADWLDFLRDIAEEKLLLAGPPVILTDARAVVLACQEMGFTHFLPFEDLNSSLLTDTIHAAQEHFTLKLANRELAQQHRAAQQRFQDVADQFADWLWEIDAELTLLFTSSRKRPSQGAEVGSKFTQCFLPDERIRIEDDFNRLKATPKPFRDVDYWSFDAHGTRMCWSLSGTPVYDDTGEVTGFRGIARDVSDEKSSVDQLYHLANNDPVTGVYNRSRLFDELDRTLRVAQKEERSGAVLLVDVDHFAYINETHGHRVGDKLLVHIAQVLKDNIRSGDIIGRMAGDEFALIMPDVPRADISYHTNRLRDALQASNFPMETGTLSFNVSVGVVRFPQHGKTADELLNKVFQMVGEAKEKGRNRIEIFKEAHTGTSVKAKNLEWLDFVSRCLDEEEERLVLYYQPIVPLNSQGHKQFYEVLVRMVDHNGDLVVPTKFISAAEDFGIVNKIDRTVTTRSIEMLKLWHKQGRDVHLSINISARTFDDEDFLTDIAKQLEESGLPKGALVFEITETSLLRDLALVRQFIARMREAGASFALDDCGVGYSSFNYIRHLDLDYIKIDGSFIRNLHISSEDDAFVTALRDVARQKEILTVAEMVEHVETATRLREMGIDYGQGFYFAEPGPEIDDPDDDTVH